MVAVAEARRSAGTVSRMTLMPSGMTPAASPCRARPTIIGPTVSLSAASTEPTTSTPRLTSSMRRLPYMSPRRPMTGVATPPLSRVAVTTQAVRSAVESSRVGSCGTSGTMSVCMSETTIPENARIAMISPGRTGPSAVVVGASGVPSVGGPALWVCFKSVT